MSETAHPGRRSRDPHAGWRALWFACVALLSAVLWGCAGRVPARSDRAAPPARPAPGYDRRLDALDVVDMSALAGKRVALDPGHGGRYPGSLGPGGLTEAEVNLGVALHLRGLLEARGALVMMTRTDDRDFSSSDSSLRGDLAARTALANAWNPDLFISIHHNADAGGRNDRNEIQTYYKFSDDGPSLDAAESVHRYLVRNLGIARHVILPGNYFVLRNSVAPALLTESSFITNPDVEARLALAGKQRLEAEALLLGIAHHFARGAPRVASFTAHAPRSDAADSTFSDVAAPVLRARVDGAFDAYRLTLDGVPLDGVRRGAALEWRPGRLAGGAHEAVLRVALAGRGAAPIARLAFRLLREPVELEPATFSPPLGIAGGIAAIRFDVQDGQQAVYRESTFVRVIAMNKGIAPNDTLLVARDGEAWGYFRVAPRTWPAMLQAWIGDRSWESGIEADAHNWSLARRGEVRADQWAGFLREATSGEPLRNLAAAAWLNRDGFAVLERDADGAPWLPTLPGYRPAGSRPNAPPDLVAIAGGVLHGRRIVLDPDGGGDEARGTGANGTRAAHLNLRVARSLQAMLEAAGARVMLTRDGDFALSDVERVQISEAFGAERYLRIGHRAEPARLGHYFSSAGGKAWAGRVAETLEAFGFARARIGEDAQYPLQQTSCPALFVSAARIDDRASEEMLLAAGSMRREAYALFVALAREWAADASWPLDSLSVHDSSGTPVAAAAVTLGNIVLETDARGRIGFARTEPGPIEVRVEHARATMSRTLLETERGVVLTGPDGR